MAKIIRLGPKEIPAALREIPEPPKELYIEGALPDPEEFAYLTVVGSRKYSSYGREACEKLVSELAGWPVVIVSGLALGIDTIAHQAALAAGLTTLALPGSGLARSVIHPHSNARLADKIVAAGGALISEFPAEYPAGLHTFPRRNRLMAGLAKAVLIIEAGEKSGTLITARLTTDYNRELLVVPGSIFSAGSIGTNRLVRAGATPVTCGNDVLEALGFDVAEQKSTLPFADLSPDEQKVVELLQIEPLPRDELIRALALDTSAANSLLGIMEIKGLIKEAVGEIRLV